MSRIPRRHALALATLMVGAALPPLGCTAGLTGDPEPDVTFDREGLLVNVADNVIFDSTRSFASSADALDVAVGALAAAVAVDPAAADDERAAAQQAFAATMGLWQRVEAVPVGPVAPPSESNPDGQGYRDAVYSWPTTNPCNLDGVIASEGYAAAGFPEGQQLPRFGLDAVEYLLFHTAPGNSCAEANPLNQDGTWAALGADVIAARRAAYAKVLTAHTSTVAADIVDAWERQGGYRAKLTLEDGSLYDDSAEALDAVFAGLLYLDTNVKDLKLALPAGIHMDCAAAICPDSVELRFSKLATLALAANLRMTRDVVSGKEGLGFDDYLVAVDAAELATTLTADLDAAIAAVEAIPDGDLEAALATDHASVVAAHAAVRVVTDDLKTQFMAALGLNPPNQGPVDND